jgi:hypothetical protein
MKKKVILILIFSIVIIGMGYVIYRLNRDVDEKKLKITILEKASKNVNERFNRLSLSMDSLKLINDFLARYRTLTVAMTYRDSVRSSLKYKIGDVVRLKRDSARVIISDIVVGGGKYEYYIKYKIMLKNGQEEEVAQEMLY